MSKAYESIKEVEIRVDSLWIPSDWGDPASPVSCNWSLYPESVESQIQKNLIFPLGGQIYRVYNQIRRVQRMHFRMH